MVVAQLQEYGEVVSVAWRAPSRKNSTFVTPTASVAVAATATVPETVAPAAGEVIEATGAVVSAGAGAS